MEEKVFLAVPGNLPDVLAFVESALESADCPMKASIQIQICVEEMFVNVAHYAYADKEEKGYAKIKCEQDGNGIIITLEDEGIPFDPLKKIDPDTTLASEDRQIGGLGIFMVKKSMDEVHYKYLENKNIFTMKKYW